MPEVEQALREAWDGHKRSRIEFSIICNPRSTSKAENVNEGVARTPKDIEFLAIMDAHHHRWEDHAHKAVAIMNLHHNDVLQARPRHAYNVGHRGRTSLFGVGVFGGSNGCWRRPLLDKIGMDKKMLTEDIDASLRATRRGVKIGFSSFLRSSEGPGRPTRSARYASRGCAGRRAGLRWHEVFVYVTLHPLLLLLTYVSRDHDVTVELLFIVGGGAIVSVGMFRVIAAFLLARGQVRGNVLCFGLYFFLQLPWTMYMHIIQAIAHGQMVLVQNMWIATVCRSANGEMPSPAKGPPPQVEVDLKACGSSPRSLPPKGSYPDARTVAAKGPADAQDIDDITRSVPYALLDNPEDVRTPRAFRPPVDLRSAAASECAAAEGRMTPRPSHSPAAGRSHKSSARGIEIRSATTSDRTGRDGRASASASQFWDRSSMDGRSREASAKRRRWRLIGSEPAAEEAQVRPVSENKEPFRKPFAV
eukprot:jgi/Ulvmu1/1229/UM109_0027.1